MSAFGVAAGQTAHLEPGIVPSIPPPWYCDTGDGGFFYGLMEMALGWITMRNDLHTHPKVVRISSALKADILRTIGGLHSVWCLFDVHSTDGKLVGYTADIIDQMVRWPGFAQAMADQDWLHLGVDFVACPEFDKHNSKCAKKRAEDCERKRRGRMSAKCPQNVPQESGQIADKNRTTEQNRTEQKNAKASPTPSGGNSADADQAEDAISGSALEFVRDSWNASGPITCIRLTEKLRRAARARLKVPWWSENWLLALERLPQCRFLWGESDRGWKADLEWFLKPDSVQKILEGKYDNAGSTEQNSREQSSFERSIDALAKFAASDETGSRAGTGSPLLIEANNRIH